MSDEKFNEHCDTLHDYWGTGFNFRRFAPWYSDKADYNTNAKSYYDYLARSNQMLFEVEEVINRLLKRDIQVEDTPCIDFTKIGDWKSHGECNNYDDVITLKADVVLSKFMDNQQYPNIVGSPFQVPNAISCRNDGLYAPDFSNVLHGINAKFGAIDSDLATIKNDITKIKNDLTTQGNALKKIIENLYNSGAITSNDFNFSFNTGRNIATGNINLFGGTQDGNSFIRTSKTAQENDLTGGI